ncbi:hypothetical protein Hanom_Chr09g00859751 [Helianthus anomalus]
MILDSVKAAIIIKSTNGSRHKRPRMLLIDDRVVYKRGCVFIWCLWMWVCMHNAWVGG